uniref:Uncharacterized protein n=1 Tax=Arundo donax TaxID=35708 RepID=A0A0A9D3L9_ARUDO
MSTEQNWILKCSNWLQNDNLILHTSIPRTYSLQLTKKRQLLHIRQHIMCYKQSCECTCNICKHNCACV